MADEHTSALTELGQDRDMPELASLADIKSLGKKNIFQDANYPYERKIW